MYLNRLLLLFITLLLSSTLFSQQRRPQHLPYYDNALYHFGFLLGYNRMNFTINHTDNFANIDYTGPFPNELTTAEASSMKIKSIEARADHGFNIGIVSDLHLGQFFDLRFTPTLSFGQRNLTYIFTREPLSSPAFIDTIIIDKPDIFITFVDFPLYLKFKSARLNNIRHYMIGGAKYSLDLTSKNKRVDFLRLYRNDIYLDLGTGIDFYTEYFKFGVELKMSYGLRNLMNRSQSPQTDFIYINGIETLRSKIFMLSLTFE